MTLDSSCLGFTSVSGGELPLLLTSGDRAPPLEDGTLLDGSESSDGSAQRLYGRGTVQCDDSSPPDSRPQQLGGERSARQLGDWRRWRHRLIVVTEDAGAKSQALVRN